MSFITISNITKNYGRYCALDNISLSIEQGEFICVLGPSGCGKTALLNLLAGSDGLKQYGNIRCANNDITYLSSLERKFGLMFERNTLTPSLTVKENILSYLIDKNMNVSDKAQLLDELLSLVGLNHEYKNSYPTNLTNIQCQQVILARAMVNQPQVLLIDDAWAFLSAPERNQLGELTKSLQQQLSLTVLMMTSNKSDAMKLADRLVIMNKGRIEQVGRPQFIAELPANEFVANFIL